MLKNDIGKNRFLAIMEAMSEGILLINRKNRIAMANRSAEEMLFWAAPLEGRDITDVFSSSTLERSLKSVGRNGDRTSIKVTCWKGSTGDKAIVKGKGREKQYSLSITPIDDKYIVISAEDITEIERLSHVRQDFVSNVSHELKTPLTAISGFAETLTEADLSAEDTRRFASIILKNSTHMQRIVSDLLLLTSLDREEIEPAMKDTSDEAIFSEVKAYTAYRAEEKGMAISYEPAGIAVRCQESLIVQAVMNLVVNAVSYSPAGSGIAVRSRARGGMMDISVQDHGVGIARQDIARIFERFYRVDKGRSRESGGTGLGLSIVRHIAMLHGGTIKVESELGKGSVFTLSIPVS